MWLFVSSCVYEIHRLLNLLVGLLACIASNDERDIPSKFGVSTPAYWNFCVSICLLYDSLLGVLVYSCVARCNG